MIAAAGAVLSGCRGDLSALDPAGPPAEMVSDLWWVMLSGAGVIFLLMMALFSLVLFRPTVFANVSAKQWMGFGGIAMPVPVLIALLLYAFVQGERLFGAGTPAPGVTVKATSRMWSWDFNYTIDGKPAFSRDTLHIPVGEPVRIETTSMDVIHSFWVPRLGGKIDSIPGQTNSIVLQADVEGTFGGICSEYCGEGHQQMTFRVNSYSRAQFDAVMRELGQ